MRLAKDLRAMYSVSEISEALGIPISTLYYKPKEAKDESVLDEAIKTIFEANNVCYGRRRIKEVLRDKHGIIASERKISKRMNILELESIYIKGRMKKPKPSTKVNNSADANLLQRQFSGWPAGEVVLCDLTYIKINKWYYLCVLLELSRREVIGYSFGSEKSEELVRQAIYSCKIDLRRIHIFHTDRGGEFSGQVLAGILQAMGIQHSLSAKGEPCDNSPMEAFYKTFKTEFLKTRRITSVEEMRRELSDWMYWYNHIRIHSSLNYQPPILPVLEVVNET